MIVQPPLPGIGPESAWVPPDSFPELRGNAKWISIDCETKDPFLQTKGPGFIRGDAHVIGVAVRADGFSGYYPVRHSLGFNLAPNIVFPWLADQLKGDEPKFGANLLYDLEALYFSGVENVSGPLYDVQTAEPLLDDETMEGYSLNVLAKKYLGKEKNEDLLREAASVYHTTLKSKNKWKKLDAKNEIWVLPPEFVGPYAEIDTLLPVEIFEKQRVVLERDRLWDIFTLERRLIPILLKMRIRGIRVDIEAAHILAKEMTEEIDTLSMKVIKAVGFDPNVDSGQDLERAYVEWNHRNPLNRVGINRTPLGNPSFTKDWFVSQEDPLSALIAKKRKLMTMRDDFVLGDIIGEQVNGRVHAQFHPLRQDDRGTRSGRMSSTNPNLQQVPARDEEWAPLIRGLFIADEGQIFFKGDYSQQEPRLLVHYASLRKLPGADEAVRRFRENPLTDYHQMTADIISEKSGRQFTRKRIKGINLGIMYTMGVDKLARMLDVTEEEAVSMLSECHAAIPFMRALSNELMGKANQRGWIRTLLGRLCRFTLWEPAWARKKLKVIPLPKPLAIVKWPNERLKRANTHKALNRLIQGSAADQTKKAMVDLWYDHGILVQLPVHDELAGSIPSIVEAIAIKEAMEHCVVLEIPVVCDARVGPSWGKAKRKLAA